MNKPKDVIPNPPSPQIPGLIGEILIRFLRGEPIDQILSGLSLEELEYIYGVAHDLLGPTHPLTQLVFAAIQAFLKPSTPPIDPSTPTSGNTV